MFAKIFFLFRLQRRLLPHKGKREESRLSRCQHRCGLHLWKSPSAFSNYAKHFTAPDSQPRSGVILQPTAQAVGERRESAKTERAQEDLTAPEFKKTDQEQLGCFRRNPALKLIQSLTSSDSLFSCPASTALRQ